MSSRYDGKEVTEPVIDGTLDNGTDLTGTVNVSAFNQLSLDCDYLHQDTVTSLTIAVAKKRRDAATLYNLVEEDASPPYVDFAIVTPRTYRVSDLASASDNTSYRWTLDIPVAGLDEVQITVAAGGVVTGDGATMKIYATKTVQ